MRACSAILAARRLNFAWSLGYLDAKFKEFMTS